MIRPQKTIWRNLFDGTIHATKLENANHAVPMMELTILRILMLNTLLLLLRDGSIPGAIQSTTLRILVLHVLPLLRRDGAIHPHATGKWEAVGRHPPQLVSPLVSRTPPSTHLAHFPFSPLFTWPRKRGMGIRTGVVFYPSPKIS